MGSGQVNLVSWTRVMSCVILVIIQRVLGGVELEHKSTVYLPSAEAQRPKYDAGSVEQIAYDAQSKLIYAAGKNVYHVIRVTAQGQLITELTRYEDIDFTDVEVCGGRVYMTGQSNKNRTHGFLRVYGSYSEGQLDPFPLIEEIQVGSLPDMVTIRKDCKTAIVAVEAEAYQDGSVLKNPEGEVAIVHLADGSSGRNSSVVRSLNFNAFDDRYQDLKPSGVRFVYQSNNNTLSSDIEPEFITVDESMDRAYVCLQENNAIAEVDLVTENITRIHGLGYKQWGSLDASDKDTGISVTYWPIRAWYIPDTIKFHQWKGHRLLFTSNEGDAKEYDLVKFDETTKGITKGDIGDAIHPMVKDAIEDDARLGRLKLSRYEGKDQSGKYQALYTYGGRSFSIWSLPADREFPMTQLFDSGSDFEEKTALHCPHLFNLDEDKVDGRSDNKGPEPESLALAEMNGCLYVFVGIERPGIIIVYSIGRDVSRPRFETIFCGGIPDNGKTMIDKFNDREIYAADPEDMRFVNSDESPTGSPVLMVAGTVSGTVTLLEVKITDSGADDQHTDREERDDTSTEVECRVKDSSGALGPSLALTVLTIAVHYWENPINVL